ncbi:MAG: CopG family ribbon-helix-helix protein [Chloroflexota bacterium]
MPVELLKEVDRWQQERGTTRSEVIRRAIEQVLREEQERKDDEEFRRAYREQPETDEGFGWVDQVALESLADLPWEEKQNGETRGGVVGQAAPAMGAEAGAAGGARRGL